MKQSTKLLSLVLALVMAFSFMTVIGNAIFTFTSPNNIAYDNIDDANLTYEQVADIALDLVDDLLADANIEFSVDLSILGKLEVDLRSVDRTFETLWETADGGLFKAAAAIVNLGALEELSFNALATGGNAYQRKTNGNFTMISQLVQFLADNISTLKKAVYGINTDNGISLGIIGSFIDLDMGEINAILTDLPGFAVDMVYDLIVAGSYNDAYENDSYPSVEDLEESNTALPFTDIDVMLNNAILNLLINPQDYEWVGEGEAATKVWDMDSIIVPELKAEAEENGRDAVIANFDLRNKSVFQILDYAAQYAIDGLAVNALNHNLKKNLMEAVEVEFNEIADTDVDAAAKAIFDAGDYVTYIGYDCLEKGDDGIWYYTTFETRPVDENGDGEQDIDPETEEPLSERVPVYYKANTATANSFYSLINWDYKILKSSDEGAIVSGQEGVPNAIDYDAILALNGGTLVESLNHILYIVFETALSEETKQAFIDTTGDGWIDGTTTDCINDNVNRLAKYLLATFPDKIFGSDSPYADTETYTYDFYADMTLIDIVALIGPSFFDGVMPQLIIPKDAETGAYTFATSEGEVSVALLQFASLVVREFMTEIAPNVNYDAYIFEAGSLTAATGRQFADHNSAEWMDILLNMGMDIAATYLMQLTNFKDYCAKVFGADFDLNGFITVGGGTDQAHWNAILDTAIEWAVNYVSNGSGSVLQGLEPSKVAGIASYTTDTSSSLKKLGYILNTILPLGFINGLEGTYDVDAEVLLTKLEHFFTTFDLTTLTSLFGRNGLDGDTLKKGNILAQPVIPMVLGLVNDIINLVFARDLLPSETTVQSNLTNAQIQAVLTNVISGLNSVKTNLLQSALPVVGKLIKGWGTEQAFDVPDISIDSSINLTGGATTEAVTVNVSNGANGIWRSYIDANGTRQYDQQYAIGLTGVKVYDLDGNTTSLVTPTLGDLDGEDNAGYIDFGETGTFTYTASGISSPGMLVRFEVSYKVYEGTTAMTNETYTTNIYTYLNADSSDEGAENTVINSNSTVMGTYSPQYIDINNLVSEIEGANVAYIRHNDGRQLCDIKITGGQSTHGITIGSATSSAEFGANTERNYDPIPLFKNGSITCTGEETDKTLTITGAGVNEATWDAAGLGSGSKDTFTFAFYAARGRAIIGGASSTKYQANGTIDLIYYDGIARSALGAEVGRETGLGKIKADYDFTETYYYADSLLNSAETTVVDGEEVKKETNFPDYAWVDSDGEVVTATVTPGEDDTIGTYTVDGVTKTAYKVTRVTAATAWTNYTSALSTAAEAALGALRSNGKFDYEGYLEDLIIASDDLDIVKKVVKESQNDAAINALKTQLDSVEATYTDNYDYTDYRMYRLNRLNDTRSDAQYFIDLKKDADRVIGDVDTSFPYTWIEEDDLKALVGLSANATAIGENGTLILALLEELDEEEYAAKEQWIEDRDLEYAQSSALDIAVTANLLTKTSTRLLNREYVTANGGAVTTHLANEIASAEAMITDESLYTERSWVKYEAALQTAKDVMNGANGKVKSQKNIFDAKWELLCCRNELVLVDEEADYSELETLIAQAEWALANKELYNNTDKELGQVLAELGLEGKVVNASGDAINLFPGSAIYTNTEPYTTEDQDIIDSAARDLKEALARLKFINLSVGATEGGNVTIAENATIIFDDPETEDFDETVTSRLATIAEGLNEAAVKALFNVEADNATVGEDNISVSNDLHYSVEKFDEEGNPVAFEGFAGTNSVVTFYTVQDGIKIPVATVKIIVNADINGDGAADVIDGAQLNLVASDKASLEGCYFIAGNLAGATDDTRTIDANDYLEVINVIKK